jgi:uncharacterized protein YjbJ (UPF0337 family)
MNKDVFQGNWKQIRGEAKKWFGKLTDDDIRQVEGDRDKMIGKLQERYGYSKDEAARNLDRRLDDFGKKTTGV